MTRASSVWGSRADPLRLATCIVALLTLAWVAGVPRSEARQAPANRPDLAQIFEELRSLRQARVVDGIPDYSVAAVEAQKRQLSALRVRFDALDPSGWPTRDVVDYLLVRSELDMLD